jgi:hypothetical protein
VGVVAGHSPATVPLRPMVAGWEKTMAMAVLDAASVGVMARNKIDSFPNPMSDTDRVHSLDLNNIIHAVNWITASTSAYKLIALSPDEMLLLTGETMPFN